MLFLYCSLAVKKKEKKISYHLGYTLFQEDGWQVEQDRELDQVPSRLEPGEVLVPQPPPTQP
jgi:hypothetical protein